MSFNKRKFLEINDFYPDSLVSDNYSIYKQVLTDEHLELCVNNIGELYKDKVKVGKEYLFLVQHNLRKTMMSNHESETITNQKFIDVARGEVLVFGLGIGLIIFPILQDSEIKKITIVEIDNGLIEIVSPVVKNRDVLNKLEIINADAFTWETEKKFDTIYFDIWHTINTESFDEMERLKERYLKNLSTDGWIDSWCSELNPLEK